MSKVQQAGRLGVGEGKQGIRGSPQGASQGEGSAQRTPVQTFLPLGVKPAGTSCIRRAENQRIAQGQGNVIRDAENTAVGDMGAPYSEQEKPPRVLGRGGQSPAHAPGASTKLLKRGHAQPAAALCCSGRVA